MRTRYLLKAGFKHSRRKPSLSQGRLGLALNSEQQERLRSIFPILPRRKGKARSRKACAGTRKYIRRRDETEMLVCHQRHQKIGDKKDGDLSTHLFESAWRAGHEWRIQRRHALHFDPTSVAAQEAAVPAISWSQSRGGRYLSPTRLAERQAFKAKQPAPDTATDNPPRPHA